MDESYLSIFINEVEFSLNVQIFIIKIHGSICIHYVFNTIAIFLKQNI